MSTNQEPVATQAADDATDGLSKSILPAPQGQFKLISVSFKEAALDSPSFRASVNHLDRQIDNIDKWLHALMTSIHKIPKHIKDLQGYYNSFLEHLVPTFLQDGLIDQEYTVLSMQVTLEGLKKLWGECLKALSVDTYMIDNLYAIVSKNIAHYRGLRLKFEKAQEKHDKYLALYASTAKTKDPLSTIEDAKQLFAVRKSYLTESLNLVIELSTLGNLLDKTLVKLSTDVWARKRSYFGDDLFFKEVHLKIQRIQGWCDSYTVAVDKLSTDMLSARKQVEESSMLQFLPLTNLNDYRSASINLKTLRDVDEPGFEKHGYLLMKTWVEKSTKPIWVRRWAFIKTGVFGLLVLSQTKTYVQETDKIGVLLCNVKYSANEERRFCFEVKTSDFTVVFQAETLVELKSWLKVFDNEKQRILNSMADDPELFNIASGRYPPIISELALTANTSIDREFTNTRIVHSLGQIITSSTLASHIEKNERSFQKQVYYQIPQIKPPTMTDTTKSSIIAYSIATATSVPTALKANIWGSVNWGIYYLHNALHEGAISANPAVLDYELIEQQKQLVDSGIFYPDYYSPELIPLDIQMRALFETAVEPGEYCLLSYRCIWSPNSRQELGGRCFVTSNHIFFYMQALGFVASFKGNIGNLVSVDYTGQKNYDLLRIHTVNGSIKMKLFLDDAKVVKRKTLYLIANRVSEKPKFLKDLIPALDQIDIDIKREKRTAQLILQIRMLSKGLPQDPNLENSKYLQAFLPGDKSPSLMLATSKGTTFRTDFSEEYGLLSERLYPIPPKALFHTLLGDNSTLLQDQVFGTLENINRKPWSTNVKGHLERSYISTLRLFSRRSQVAVRQVVEVMHDDEYYTFTHQRGNYAFNIGLQFGVEYRFVIIGNPGKNCHLYTYGKLQFETKLVFNKFIDMLCQSIGKRYNSMLHRRIRQCILDLGTHGITVKLIYLHGQLSHTNELEQLHDAPITRISFSTVTRMFVTQYMISALSLLVHAAKIAAGFIAQVNRSLRANWIFIFIIGLLTLSNAFLIGKTTISFWVTRRSEVFADTYLEKYPVMLQRAVYMKDTQDWLQKEYLNKTESSSRCVATFQNKSFVRNYGDRVFWDEIYGDEQSKSVARALLSQFQDIGIQRHSLLVKLRILSTLEEEIAQAEWHNWLSSEIRRCEFLKYNILEDLKDQDKEILQGIVSIVDFCLDCARELKEMGTDPSGLF